ncbi:MAG: YtxH domain-containing protein [Nitrospiraceae bacterium]|nr:MAG: YtxH domain-containing protein [Nitrospiraceae bacterium]
MSDERGCSASGHVVLAFVLGGLVGAGIALLTAPRSGRETRERIREFSDESRKKASEYTEHAKEKLSSAVEHGKEFISEKKSLISSAIEAGKDAYTKEKEKHTHSS